MTEIANKTCRVCLQEKPITEFYIDRGNIRNDCKVCNSRSGSIWQKNNLARVRLKNKRWVENNKEHFLKWRGEYAPIMYKKRRERYKNDINYRNKTIKRVKIYRNNPKNKEKIRYIKRRLRKEYFKDPIWRMRMNLRRRLLHVLHGNRKAECTMKMVGCSLEQLKEHIQKQFKNDMSWENYGLHGWHIDHIKPCALFDFSKPEDQKACFHYTNLQPLWAKDNLEKGNKYVTKSKYESFID